MSPADPFTYTTKDKIHQLAALFGCEYRAGGAKSAPLPRPHDVQGREGGHPSNGDELPAVLPAEIQIHNTNRLPHLQSDDEIERYIELGASLELPFVILRWADPEGRAQRGC